MYARVFIVSVVSLLAAIVSAAPGGTGTNPGTAANPGTVTKQGTVADQGTAAKPCTVGSQVCCASIQNVRYCCYRAR